LKINGISATIPKRNAYPPTEKNFKKLAAFTVRDARKCLRRELARESGYSLREVLRESRKGESTSAKEIEKLRHLI
jgi:hypothetical protein